MGPEVVLALTKNQHDTLHDHLFPGDGCEAVAIALCGRRNGEKRHKLLVREIHPVPYEQCSERSQLRLTWSTETLVPLIKKAKQKGWSILKVHSHLDNDTSFSLLDDDADRDLFPSVYGWMDNELPHISVIMRPTGYMFGRVVTSRGDFTPLSAVNLVGDDLMFWRTGKEQILVPEFGTRVAQTFGEGTYDLLRSIKAGVIGCSGTGGLMVEQLARNGIGKLLLVDPDVVEEKNLNRIPNTTQQDAINRTAKVSVLSKSIEKMGLGTEVMALQKNLIDPETVLAVADCDIVFGCLDTVEGRHVLNRLASFYTIPYIDMGVRLIADGNGNVDEVCGNVHYLKPDGSSLLSRELYTEEELRAESLFRTNPKEYEARRKDGYIKNVTEEKPAVISVNMTVAALAMNEFLARIHPFRVKPNADYAIQRFSLAKGFFHNDLDGHPCAALSKHVGRGDVDPLLDFPSLHIEPK